jgi:hypothetical protein
MTAPRVLHFKSGIGRIWSSVTNALAYLYGARKKSFMTFRLELWSPKKSEIKESVTSMKHLSVEKHDARWQ